MNSITVLLVGAGRFGANYINVLGDINTQPGGRFPPISRLIVSRTRQSAAEDLAAQIAARPRCDFDQVTGVQINGIEQLREVLGRYAPALTCITARDPVIGDDIHAPYTLAALDCGAVLCEKPFSLARGDGASLRSVEALAAHPHAARFGLELPMAVVGRAMAADSTFSTLLGNARGIDFVWQRQSNHVDLISDLALHPWSMLPLDGQIEVTDIRVAKEPIDIRLRLTAPSRSLTAIPCRIQLAGGGVFRGMRIDGRAFQIQFHRGQVQIWEYAGSWMDVINGRVPMAHARLVLAVDNPLRRHIEAALSGNPLVDAARTGQSQRFLEVVCIK